MYSGSASALRHLPPPFPSSMASSDALRDGCDGQPRLELHSPGIRTSGSLGIHSAVYVH
jgi:hypothetical protein